MHPQFPRGLCVVTQHGWSPMRRVLMVNGIISGVLCTLAGIAGMAAPSLPLLCHSRMPYACSPYPFLLRNPFLHIRCETLLSPAYNGITFPHCGFLRRLHVLVQAATSCMQLTTTRPGLVPPFGTLFCDQSSCTKPLPFLLYLSDTDLRQGLVTGRRAIEHACVC